MPANVSCIVRGLVMFSFGCFKRLAGKIVSEMTSRMSIGMLIPPNLDCRCSRTKTMEQSARASASIRDTHNLRKTIKDIFVF